MPSTCYIPPPGLFFRLIGYVSQHAIFSRNAHDAGHSPVSHGEQSDQWFTLLHDSQNYPGRYAIKGTTSGRVLFSRSLFPRVGHLEGDGQHDDNWFIIEPGPSPYTNCFRLITPWGSWALYSRSSPDPTFWNHDKNEFFPDQLFSFLWEEMEVNNVEFDLAAGKIVTSKQITLAERTLKNNSDGEQEISFSVDKTITNSSTFEYGAGFTATVGMEFWAAIPFTTGGELEVEVSNGHTWTWGETTRYDTRYTAALPIKAGPRKSIRVSSVVTQGVLEVPFTMHLSSKRAPEVKVQTTGTWRGVSSWGYHDTTTTLNLSLWA